jgi:hypothetical protein
MLDFTSNPRPVFDFRRKCNPMIINSVPAAPRLNGILGSQSPDAHIADPKISVSVKATTPS